MLQAAEPRRGVVVDGVEYFVEVRRSQPRHHERFATRCYAIVELPQVWQATLPVPDGVRAAGQLWYRELIELVDAARRLVSQRAPVAA